MFSRLWTGWRTALVTVKPETVIAWHRRGFRLWWTWKSRHRLGRPTVPADVRTLIRAMAEANPRWGAPRIHGELEVFKAGQVPTPVDDHPMSRLLAETARDDEELMRMRTFPLALFERRLLAVLRRHECERLEKGDA